MQLGEKGIKQGRVQRVSGKFADSERKDKRFGYERLQLVKGKAAAS